MDTLDTTSDMNGLNRLPVIVILGATGTGKSKLAIDLAAKFGGEIISADSMQVYRGLDILTNKVTEDEKMRIPHHMIGIINHSKKFDVTCYRNQTLPLVESILKQGKLPFIVGGTNYYIESILWKILIDQNASSMVHPETTVRKRKLSQCVETNLADNEILAFAYARQGVFEEGELRWSSDELHQALQEIDPERAMRLHPKDKRKIIRSIQIRFRTGRKHSDLIAEQCIAAVEDEVTPDPPIEDDKMDNRRSHFLLTKQSLGGPLRFQNCLCLWIQAPQEILDSRIEKRVDEMVQKGLRKELDDYMDILRNENSELNFEEGLLQSIGFKEFTSYIQISPSERETDEADSLFEEGKERLKIVTKQYARKQLKWIKHRFLRPDRREVPPVYWLDGSLASPVEWERNVTSVGESILEAYLMKKFDLPILAERKVAWIENYIETDLIARTCEICDNRVFIGKIQWEQHIQSAKHRKMLKRKDKTLKTGVNT